MTAQTFQSRLCKVDAKFKPHSLNLFVDNCIRNKAPVNSFLVKLRDVRGYEFIYQMLYFLYVQV